MRFIISVVLLLAASGNTLAATPNFNYTYVDVEYRQNNFDRFDGDGIKLEAAYFFGDRYFLFGSYSDDSSDIAYSVSTFVPDPNNPYIFVGHVKNEASSTDISMGAGVALPISEAVDFVGKLFYSSLEVEVVPGGTYEIVEGGTVTETGPLCSRSMCIIDEYDHSGLGLEAGLRGAMSENFELFGNLRYIDRDLPEPTSTISYVDAFDKATYELGLRYSATEKLSIGLAASRRGDFELTQLSARFSF